MIEKRGPVVGQITDYMYNKAAKLKIPLSGTFELSPVCNFNCRMCYVRKSAKEVAESPRPILTLDRWLAIAREAREQGMLYLLLTGGEPFLWPDFWTLYEQLIGMGFLVSINTNGSLIDEDAIERLKRYPPRRINITLYGASDEVYENLCQAKGVFTRVKRAIEGLQDAGITVKLNGSLMPANICDLEKLIAYAEERKLILETTAYMFPPVRRDPTMVGVNQRLTPEEAAACHLRVFRLQNGEDKYKAYLESIRNGTVQPPGPDASCTDPLDGRVSCRAGKAAFWVTWDGWLTPCGMMTEPKVDINEGTFTECWQTLTQQTEALVLSGVCSHCADRALCHCCAAMALAETGSTSGIPAYLCAFAAEVRRLAYAQT